MLSTISDRITRYKYDTVEVDILGRKYKAFFPTDHSRIKGLIYIWRDNNSYDDWANIPDWQLIMYVLWKGNEKWEPVNDTKWRRFKNGGLYTIFYELESDVKQKEIKREERIKELEEMIPRLKEELKELKRKL